MQLLIPLLLVVVSLAVSVVATRTEPGSTPARNDQGSGPAGWSLNR